MLIFIDDLGAIFNVDSPLSCFTQEIKGSEELANIFQI